MHLVQFCTQPPEILLNCNCVCKSRGYHIIYGFGVDFCKDCNDDVLMMFCATHLDRVWPPYPGSICLFLSLHHSNFSACWKCCSFDPFNSVSCHLQIFSSNQHLTYCLCNVAGFQLLLHLPCVKFTDTTPSPESMITFHVVLFMLYAFVVHAMLTCYLHPK